MGWEDDHEWRVGEDLEGDSSRHLPGEADGFQRNVRLEQPAVGTPQHSAVTVML